jgi:hypothetical protein
VRSELGGTGSGLYPIARRVISDVEPSDSDSSELVSLLVSWLLVIS